MFKVGTGLRGSGKVAGGRQGQAAGEGCKVQNAGALWGLDLEPWEKWKVGLASEANSCWEPGRELSVSLSALHW